MASAKVETITVSKYTIELTEQEWLDLLDCLEHAKGMTSNEYLRGIASSLCHSLKNNLVNKTTF
jgi:hypothetical protein